jgi:hypothetical protein
MDWHIFTMSFISAMVGAGALWTGQKIEWYMNTWKCPHCKSLGKKFHFTTADQGLREEMAKDHLRQYHPSSISQ